MSDSDFDADKSPSIIATIVVLGLIAPVAVSLRFIARHKARAPLWWDDWLSLIAGVVVTAIASSAIYAATIGSGRHVAWIMQENPQNIAHFLSWIFSQELLYVFAIGPIKCSILMLYIRLFGVRKHFVRWCAFMIGLTCAWCIASFFAAVFQCRRISDAWSPTSSREGCIDLRLYFIGQNIPNAAMDFLILVTPLYPISKLQLPIMKKVFVSSLLLIGAGEVAFSTVRFVMLITISTEDPTWNYTPAVVWSFVEMSVGVTCACLPCLGPLLPKKTMNTQSYGWSHGETEMTQRITKLSQQDDESRSEDVSGSYEMIGIQKTTEISMVRTQDHSTPRNTSLGMDFIEERRG